MKKFFIRWINGKTETIYGKDIYDAVRDKNSNMNYVDYYQELL